MINHSSTCDAAQNELRSFLEAHPNCCRHCRGRGFVHYPGSREEPPSTDACGCLENGNCPQCAGALVDGDGPARCSVCGWDEERANERPCPYPIMPDPECCCWEE